MKIVHVLESLQMGGMERLVADLAETQKVRGHDVCVYTISTSGPLEDRLKKAGVPVFNCHKKRGFDAGCIRTLKKKFAEKRFEIVHTHNGLANVYAAVAAKLSGIKKVINTRHGSVDPRQKSLWLWKVSFLFTNRIVFVCKKAKDEFDGLKMARRKKGLVIYNGINVRDWTEIPVDGRDSIVRDFKLAPETKIIGVICRLDLLKDIDTLITAFEIVQRDNPNIVLFIVGDGSQKSRLQEMVKTLRLTEKVVFPGERKDVKPFLAAMDIFVLPSLAEGISIALLEAMAFKRPIITTNVGGTPELITDEAQGRLISAKDPQTLATCIKEYLANPSLAAMLGENAHQRVVSHFTTERMADD
ncbi:MAG: hypothetical protein COW13_00255, partial [Candidatus Omnitrophica bacterium CG12_big_fil_rev_8_21_14_0_65_50_5]